MTEEVKIKTAKEPEKDPPKWICMVCDRELSINQMGVSEIILCQECENSVFGGFIRKNTMNEEENG